MKQKVSLVILIMLLSFTTSFALVDENKILDDIATSINEHPEHWIDTGSNFVYSDDTAKMKILRKMSWPEHESNLVFIYNFYTNFNYIQLEKPFQYDFEGEKLKELMEAIKLYKLNKLMNDVESLLKKKNKSVMKQSKPPEKKTVTVEESRKL